MKDNVTFIVSTNEQLEVVSKFQFNCVLNTRPAKIYEVIEASNTEYYIVDEHDPQAKEFENAINSKGRTCYIVNLYWNDLSKDKLEILTNASKIPETIKKADFIENNNNLKYLDTFVENIGKKSAEEAKPTKFAHLDNYLDGGFYNGLYVIGAISSLGKTTLALQIADQMAQNGQDVIIFSLEMARSELIAKSISRRTASLCYKEQRNLAEASTVREITAYKKYTQLDDKQKEYINKATQDYSLNIAEHVFVYESTADMGVDEMRDKIKTHIKMTGNKPVVFIDYLQIIPERDSGRNKSKTDKQIIDMNVSELKRISRDLEITIFAISSLNRSSYNSKISMEAFKESGAIEYTSDVLLGLQFKNAGESNYKVDEEKAKSERQIELVVLKNRNGACGSTFNFNYYPKYNYFRPNEQYETAEDLEI